MSITIATVNVNGIRAAFRKGMDTWLATCDADIVLTQEVRAPAQITSELFGPDWQTEVLASTLKGRAGVGVAWRKNSDLTLSEVITDAINCVDPTDSGRWLEVVFNRADSDKQLRVVSAYLHSGQINSPKLDAKLSHFSRVEQRLAILAADSIPTVIAGDFNVVRSERDIKNWRGNHNKTSGVLDEEIAYLDRWMSKDWVDVGRQLVGQDAQGPYTWWSWRGKAFDNDAGWRIDYHMASAELAEKASNLVVGRAESYDQRFSDHAPVLVSYDW